MIIPGMPATFSHSLSEVKAGLNAASDPKQMLVTNIGGKKEQISLEVRQGIFWQATPDPDNGHTRTASVVGGNDMARLFLPHEIDPEIDEDWDWCKKRTDPRTIEKLQQAMEVCKRAYGTADLTKRKQLVNQAVSLSPKYCSMAYVMRFELICADKILDSITKQTRRKCDRALKDAVKAGRALVEVLRANEVAQGNLYTFLPARWYVRSLYMFGSFLLHQNDLDEAEVYLKEYLANDIHDKLGARHKQLYLSLERGPLKDNDQLGYLLESKFGDEQLEDDIFCLWTYTRALRRFARRGGGKVATMLLKKAIESNSHVPPLLLAWETSKNGKYLMQLGSETEASDYANSSSRFWLDTEGALEWLEKVYCEIQVINPPIANKEALNAFVQGTRNLETCKDMDVAIQHFQQVLETVQAGRMYREALRRKGLCHAHRNELECALCDYDQAALSFCKTSEDQDEYKELLYNRAECKETLGDLQGALDDYSFVFHNIGPFSTAADGMHRLEHKLGIHQPHLSHFGNNNSWKDEYRHMSALGKLLPKIDPRTKTAATQERCNHCRRGGIKLVGCSGCDGEYKFCSKECQVASWKVIHKYVCKGSKKCYLENGSKVMLNGLPTSKHYNGKLATVERFLSDLSQFSVRMEEDGREFSVHPKNLKKVH